MITIDSGKFTIPEEERFVGFAGDNLTETKEFAVFHHTARDCAFYLCLKFDDGKVKSIKLRSFYYSSDVLLEWDVKREELCSSGIVAAQIRIEYPSGEVEHTSKDYFFVSSSVDESEEADGFVTHNELNNKLTEARNAVTAEIDAAERRAKEYTDSAVADLPLPDDYYTKAEIDGMIGNAEAALSEV